MRQINALIFVPSNVHTLICVNIYVICDKYTTLFSDYSREELAPKGLQLADYEAGAEIDPDKEVPDGVPVISDLVEGDFYQGDADLTDDQKAVGSRIEQRELTELEMRQAWVGQRGAERFKWKQSSDGKVYVPYTFQNYNSYTAKERANIAGAFEQYEQKTCIRYQD